MADVGLLGFPNVGKSTFIGAVSRARPKIADYPFTTLVPQLGVVALDDFVGARPGDTMVVADIPGLVPGASEGAGLGIQFLRHVDRTRVLLHIVSLDYEEGRDPISDYDALRQELTKFDPELAHRPEVVVVSKSDLTEVREAFDDLKSAFNERGVKPLLFSAVTRVGLSDVIAALHEVLKNAPLSLPSA
jgi:GTP-binding protein